MNALTALVRIPSLRRRSLVTIVLLAAAFSLTHLRVPGASSAVIEACSGASVNGILGVADFFGGGTLSRLSVGAVGVMPFITASIILILAARISGPVARMVAARSRAFYVSVVAGTLALASGQALATTLAARRPHGLLPSCSLAVLPVSAGQAVLIAAVMIAGTGALLGLGFAITKWGLGNGISLLIAMGVLTVLPRELVRVGILRGAGTAVLAVVLLAALVAGLIWLNAQTVALPVRLGWRGESGDALHTLPIPLNPAGVMPLILASTLLSGPLVLAMIIPGEGWSASLAEVLSAPTSGWHLAGLALATVAFHFYWTIVTWDAEQMANAFSEHDVHVQGTDPAQPPAQLIDKVLLRATVISGAVMAVLAVLPSVAIAVLGTTGHFPLGGSTILVMVAIGADTLKKVRADISAEEPAADVSAPTPGSPWTTVSDAELDAALVSLGKVTHRLV